MPAATNSEIRALIAELAELTVLDEQSPDSFRARAYEKAAQALRSVDGELAAMSIAELKKIPGVGNATAKKIRSYVETGSIPKLEALRERFPAEVVQMSRIPGMGPKTLARIREELDIQSVGRLREAIDQQQLRALSGLGAKTEENLKRAIDRLGFKEGANRTPIWRAMAEALRWVERLSERDDVVAVVPCGSLRRQRETIGDIDLVVATTAPGAVSDQVVGLPSVREVVVSGEAKVSVISATGLQVDLRFVHPDQLGAALLYFTGSKAHNIRLRQLAMERGWTLNEYALSEVDSGEVVAAATEEAIYEALALPPIPPPMREDDGEIEAARAGDLPRPLQEDDLRGDLHVHTTYSGDGRSSLTDIVTTCADRGYRYLAITDHGEDLAINGVSRDDLARQADELAQLQERFPQLRLMRGCELNIAPDGSLDYDADFRAELDWCVAAVHTAFDLPPAEQTKRLIAAITDPCVRVVGHLTGRMIGRRPGIEIDIDAVLEALVEHDVLLEINSALPRLDAAAPVLRRARERGVLFAVSTDAHHVDELRRTRWGARQAQRGWVDPERVVNTWDPDRFARWLASGRDA